MTLFSCSLFIRSNHKSEKILFSGTSKVFLVNSGNLEVLLIQKRKLFPNKKNSKKASIVVELEKSYLSKIFNKKYQITTQLQPVFQKVLPRKKYKNLI